MSNLSTEQKWSWWPLLPLYPYGRKRTIFRELIPNQIWSFEQLQGIYYVAVPVRLLVVRVKNELMIINPLPPTEELLMNIDLLVKKIGPVKTIVLVQTLIFLIAFLFAPRYGIFKSHNYVNNN